MKNQTRLAIAFLYATTNKKRSEIPNLCQIMYKWKSETKEFA